ncbi:MAG: hypothetical protein RLZZ514_865, partial [Actinomycetota bacterium]
DVGFENLPKFAQVDFKILGLDGGSALSHDDSGTTEDSVAEASESELAS